MHRNDDSNYFLYIEPRKEEKSETPINDIYTEAVEFFFKRSKSGSIYGYSDLESKGERSEFSEGSGWLEIHRTKCGENSSSRDYILENGFITNSLCVFYTMWYRNSITGFNLEKLEVLKNLYLSHEVKQ